MSIFQNGGYVEGFDEDPTAAQIFNNAVGGSTSTTTPHSFGYSFTFNTSGNPGLTFGVNLVTVITGAYLNITLPGSQGRVMQWGDATANAAQCNLQLFADGHFRFYAAGGSSTTIGAASAAGLVTSGAWVYVETEVTIGASGTGSVALRINGVSVISSASVTTQSTANTWVSQLNWFCPNGNIYVDDWYMLDTTGTSPWNTYLASTTQFPQIRGDAPNANSAVGGRNAWTPTSPTGTNYSNVANIPGSATEYNADSNPGDYDMFQFPPLPANVTSVLGVNLVALLELDTSGARTVELNGYLSATDSASAAFTPVVGTPTYYNKLFTLDPTGAAWTVAHAGSCELGVKVQT